MQRIETLLQKVMDMSARGSKNTVIDIDLMMDYIKVVYGDLLEMRNRAVFTSDIPESIAGEAAPAPTKAGSVVATITPSPVEEPRQKAQPEAVTEPPVKEETNPAINGEPETIVQEKPAVRQEPVWVEVPPAYNFPEKHDIRKVIGINDKYTFISELFGDDKDMYEKTLDEISKMETHEEALEWTKENMLFPDDADGDNETARLFYDTLNKFFSER